MTPENRNPTQQNDEITPKKVMIDHDDQVELNELIYACCPELSSQRYTSFYTYSDWDTNAGYQGRLEIGSYIFESSGLQNSKEKANEASTSFAKEFFRAMLDSQMSINDSTTVESPKINITATGTSTVKSSLQILQEYVHARQMNLEWDLLLDDRKLGYKFKLKLGDKIFESDIHSRKQLAKQQCSTMALDSFNITVKSETSNVTTKTPKSSVTILQEYCHRNSLTTNYSYNDKQPFICTLNIKNTQVGSVSQFTSGPSARKADAKAEVSSKALNDTTWRQASL